MNKSIISIISVLLITSTFGAEEFLQPEGVIEQIELQGNFGVKCLQYIDKAVYDFGDLEKDEDFNATVDGETIHF